ncbi:MAG: hypothetical protein ACI8P9_004426 [Parasphingorhabdus sp.]|jgi:hypothetical protein
MALQGNFEPIGTFPIVEIPEYGKVVGTSSSWK